MRNIRWITKFAPVGVLLVLVAACGGEEEFDTDLTGEASGEVTYWLWDANQKPAYDACAEAFMAEHPDVQVVIEQYGWDDYWAKLQAGFLSQTAPDVFTDHVSKYPQFAEADQLVPLNDAIEEDSVDTNQYQEGLAELWVDESGDRYGLPKDWDTVGIFYNTELVDSAGLSDQIDQLTWNPDDGGTFEEAVAHLSIDKNGVRGDEPGFDKDNVEVYGVGYPSAGGWFGQTEWSMYALSTGWTYSDKNPWGREFTTQTRDSSTRSSG
jgi:multiple sugar transport system substrate-binding protein